MSGSFITVSTSSATLMAGAADVDKADTTKITPRNDVADTDFNDIWWVGDYSDKTARQTAALSRSICLTPCLPAVSRSRAPIRERASLPLNLPAIIPWSTRTRCPMRSLSRPVRRRLGHEAF